MKIAELLQSEHQEQLYWLRTKLLKSHMMELNLSQIQILQNEITKKNKTRFNRMAKLSENKIEIINQLIESADLEEFEVPK
jgi:hypothetical protein